MTTFIRKEENVKDILQPYLAPGEDLLWAGRPARGFILRPKDVWMILFSSYLFGFALFLFVIGIRRVGFSSVLIPASLILIPGFFLFAGRFVMDVQTRGKTFYGITRQRIIIKTGWLSPTIKYLDIRTMLHPAYIPAKNNKGIISFSFTQHQLFADAWTPAAWYAFLNPATASLYLIPDALNVYKKIIELRER